jgi:hypothetical protein
MFEFYDIHHFTGSESGWFQTLLGGLIGALISAGVAWYISRKNLDDQRRLEIERRENEKEQARTDREDFLQEQLGYFIYLIEQLILFKIDTVEKDGQYAMAYKLEPAGRPPLKIEITGNLDRIHEIDTNVIKQSLKSKTQFTYSEDVYRKLLNTIDFYKTHTKIRVERISFISKQRDELGERLVTGIDDLKVSINEKIIEMTQPGLRHPLEKYRKLFEGIMIRYERNINLDHAAKMKFHEEFLLTPFSETSEHDEHITRHFLDLFSRLRRAQYLMSRYRSNGLELHELVKQLTDELTKQNMTGTEVIQTHFNPDFLKPVA